MKNLKTMTYRDLSLTALPHGMLVTACDSCGAIGSKPADILQIPPYYCGRFTVRVALMEVLSTGAEPIVVVNAVSCEMNPTGQEIIRGVQDELFDAGIDKTILTGSTEENFPTSMTALGITVVGYLDSVPHWKAVHGGDLVYCIGKPKVGAEIKLDGDPELASYHDIAQLLQLSELRELIPTGSKGIRYEINNVARKYNLQFVPEKLQLLDLDRSTGPASCLVVITAPSVKKVMESMSNCTYIGALE